MFQEIEGQKPVVISRNHMDRVRPPVLRWMKPEDWSPAWNYERSILTGLAYGIFTASYFQVYTPYMELLKHYQSPNNFTQFRIFLRETFKMESFQRGFGTKLSIQCLYGMSYEASRFYLWRNFAGGYPHDPRVVDLSWYKKFLTAFYVGIATSWIPVPFINLAMRYEQDLILPKEYARGYRGYLHAAVTIARKDGLFPFFRGGGPIIAEKTLQTTGLFFWLDFLKDKIKHTKNFGSDHPGISENTLRTVYTAFATYVALFYGYPASMLKFLVENGHLNSKGEAYFSNYSEALWKTMGDHYNVTSLWNGFHSYLIKRGPPLFATLWFADAIGLLNQYEIDAMIVPE